MGLGVLTRNGINLGSKVYYDYATNTLLCMPHLTKTNLIMCRMKTTASSTRLCLSMFVQGHLVTAGLFSTNGFIGVGTRIEVTHIFGY